MGLTSNTGLLASVQKKSISETRKNNLQLCCEVSPAPFMLRPYACLYNPFSHNCSVLCNHPADIATRDFVKRAKDAWVFEGKSHHINEDLTKLQDQNDKEKVRTPHDIVTEDMFRRYTETDSRPLTPAPTLASGKSRGSRRCLTPDQPLQKTAIVVDLRRSHSQETLFYRGYSTSDVTGIRTSSATNERSTLPSLNLSDGTNNRRLKAQCEQLPPLASPLILSKRSVKESSTRYIKKSQLKALNIGTGQKVKKTETPVSHRSNHKDADLAAQDEQPEDSGEVRRRGKRRRKGRGGGSDRLTSAGLAAHCQQDPETQVAGIGSESQNQSSRNSIAQPSDDVVLPIIKAGAGRKTDSFLDDDILKYLHREVDEEAIATEFDVKRRYVLEEALRTRPERTYGKEMQSLLRELRTPAVSLGDWLHVPRVFSRQNAQFTLPLDSNSLQELTPMQYAARYITITKSKQLLYLTVLRKFTPEGYRMPIKDIRDGLMSMMGGILTIEQSQQFEKIMDWNSYKDEKSNPDDIKLTLLDSEYKRGLTGGGDASLEKNTLGYRTWCGLCAVCERMYGRFPPREKDSPDGMELSDFSMVETKLSMLEVHEGLREILNAIRIR